jgi:hypothetical protein
MVDEAGGPPGSNPPAPGPPGSGDAPPQSGRQRPSTTPEPPGTSDLRCSDVDRERFAERLRDHYAEGRLTLEELESRLDRVYHASSLPELYRLTSDLPHPGPKVRSASTDPKRGARSSTWWVRLLRRASGASRS